MRSHTADELKYTAQILDSDGTTVLGTARCGVEDLSGRRLEQAQLVSSETSHTLTMRYADAFAYVKDSGYISVEMDLGVNILYVVDSRPLDPRQPRPKMWLEISCHVERAGR
jgi:hypothetical protein